MNQIFCQCCAMPMNAPEQHGTNADDTVNADYCAYCYEKGVFTFHGTMEEMIEICVPHMVEADANMTPAQARAMMQEFFPSLKRWKTEENSCETSAVTQ